ncbi:MAG: SRPBCC family protein [Bdellovibrionales bacterium]|nr:SRPBCC family protein [Bdellovibrionales bacterium]
MKNLLVMAFTIFIMFVVIGLFLKKEYLATQELIIHAPHQEVFARINDLTTWLDWGVWNESDPSLNVKHGQVTKGKGATTQWEGETGNGRILITESDPQHISYDVWFAKDALKNQGEFEIEIKDGKTLVKWNMWGEVNHPILGGYIAKFMEIMNGKMAKQSLENLKLQLEHQNDYITPQKMNH